MPPPEVAAPAESGQPRRNPWMDVALGLLWLFCAWMTGSRLWHLQDWTRLAIFAAASAAYFVVTAGLLRNHYQRSGHRWYFLHQLMLLAAMVGAAPPSGYAWFLILPASSQAVLHLPPRSMAVIVSLQYAVGSIPLLYLHNNRIAYMASFTTAFLFSMGCSFAIRREWEHREKLRTANEQLRRYSHQAETLATAEERNRLSQEIHDGVAHHLTSAHVLIEAGVALLPATHHPAADPLRKAGQQVRTALQELRNSIADRPTEDLAIPLRQRIEGLIAAGAFPATLEISGYPRRCASDIEQALFRVAQEALTNAIKHAPGHAIRLSLDFSLDSHVSLRVENDVPPTSRGGDGAFGLLSLRERMRRLGGTFEAGAREPGKFLVHAEIPS